MSDRPSRAWAPCAALLATLLPALAACGPGRNQFAPPCPGQAILGDAADYNVYRSQGSRDLTDLVLHARIVNIQGSCREGDKKTQLAVTANIGVELSRGPAMAGRNIEVPVFIAVADGETILDKRTYAMQVAFPPNVDRITVTPGDVNLVLPVSSGKSGAAYTIIAGFQTTPGR
jgi:hypothetical protein